ncbi:uncharacterized protein PV07_05129 [Cladophialophora immunda]|uniref:Membrane insertase YidC/Oxa/ALB C-terminal domain-containing protein n=1 Tax=Cladophialophora immunda TaxID=569365 RepID=A0A0D2CGF9_9EURO|nr:uncharacterized protein PV07_05129 [Cladophialophora immunda]KIW29305.1 hypothetical protein PV07_05129 [Cladophialophora immunda]OQV08455.1 hypothetical protein CLAIMM_12728 [Cladophialophora immunda]
MSISMGLRWSGRGIRGAQRKVVVGSRNGRNFSHYTLNSRSIRRPDTCSTRLNSSQQVRSLSLFGWGSSKPSGEVEHPSSQSTPPSPASESTAQASALPSQPTIESTRTVKASHSTSDAADPSIANVVESDALQKVEKSVLQSQESTSAVGAAAGDTPDLASVPEGLGYLKDVCGLDFGTGPTALMQFCLEHIHVTGGLSWTASILALVLLIRGSILPFAISASDMTAKFQEISPMIRQIQARSQEALANHDRTAVLEAQMQMRELRKDAKLSFTKMFRPILFQIPLGYGAWNLLRSCSQLPVPAFEAEHFLWLSNIAVTDPIYILPITTAALTWVNLATTQRSQGGQSQLPGMGVVRNIIPLITGGFLAFQPASVQIYFLINSFFTQLQVTALQSASFRRLLKLTPLPHQRSASDTTTPYSRMNVQPTVITTTARTTTAAPEPTPTADRSLIDKGVDSVKSMGKKAWQNVSGSSKEQMEKKMKEKQLEKQKDAAARYEAQRRQDLEIQRSYRNAVASGQVPNPGSASTPKGRGEK